MQGFEDYFRLARDSTGSSSPSWWFRSLKVLGRLQPKWHVEIHPILPIGSEDTPSAARIMKEGSTTMDEAQTLFLSLPVRAQVRMRAAINRKHPTDLRKLARLVYPYVQTLAEAQSVAGFLAGEANDRVEVSQPVDRRNDAMGSIMRAWHYLHRPLHF